MTKDVLSSCDKLEFLCTDKRGYPRDRALLVELQLHFRKAMIHGMKFEIEYFEHRRDSICVNDIFDDTMFSTISSFIFCLK